jgi:hypothetical protein
MPNSLSDHFGFIECLYFNEQELYEIYHSFFGKESGNFPSKRFP